MKKMVIEIAVGVLVLVTITPLHTLAAAGNAAQFTLDTNSYIAAASSEELKTFSALTLEAWIKPNVAREWALIMGKQYNPSDSNPWYSYRLCKSNSGTFPDTVNFNIAPITTGGEVGVTSTTVVQNDVWTHVAGVYDGSTMKIYINGVLENTVPQTGDLRASDLPMYIGKAPWTNYNNFNGQMDELRIWDVARTQGQIQTYMNRSLSGNETGLIAYWQFNDTPGSPTADDSSQYSHVGTLYNGASIVSGSTAPICTDPPADIVSMWKGEDNANDSIGANDGELVGSVPFTAGKVGQAFSFDGSQDNFVNIPDDPSLEPNGAFSVDGWFYLDPSANAKTISCLVSKWDAGYAPGWGLDLQGGTDLRMSVRSDGGVHSDAALANAIPSAAWYHVAGVFDPQATPRIKLYLNGVHVASNTVVVDDAGANSFDTRIGACNWSEVYGAGNDRLNGMADEVEFINRALSDEEIAAIANAGSSGTCTSIDTTPNAFSFTDQNGVAINTVVTSDSIGVDGINFPASIFISACSNLNCEYSINSGSWVSGVGEVVNGDTIEVRQTSSATFGTTTSLTLDVGGISDTFSVTTCTATTYYRDADNDTYGDPNNSIEACSAPGGYVTDNTDCNDTDLNINPAAAEICDGIDNNCNSSTDDNLIAPANTLQQGVCAGSTQSCIGASGWVDNYSGIATYEPITETTCDTLDNDCDGTADETLTTTYYQDSDIDAYGNPSVSQVVCSQPAGYVLDGSDCNDSNASINPGAAELAGDGIDQNCDGAELCYQDSDGDTFGSINTVVDDGNFTCVDTGESTSNTDCDDANAVINPGATEICDKIDNNCDNQIDEDGVCSGGFPWPMFLPIINHNAQP
jgi:hypothetical protein